MTNQDPTYPVAEAQDIAKRKKHKKDKVRSVWISFAGRIVAQMVGALATVTLGVMVLQRGGEPRRPVAGHGEVALAVLPLDNFSVDGADDHLANGLTEMLIADLSKIDGLRVVSRTSSMRFKAHRQGLREIADELGVRWIVEGSVVRSGGRIRTTVQLIDGAADHHVWAESYDRPAGDVLAMQDEVANVIAGAVGAVLPL